MIFNTRRFCCKLFYWFTFLNFNALLVKTLWHSQKGFKKERGKQTKKQLWPRSSSMCFTEELYQSIYHWDRLYLIFASGEYNQYKTCLWLFSRHLPERKSNTFLLSFYWMLISLIPHYKGWTMNACNEAGSWLVQTCKCSYEKGKS